MTLLSLFMGFIPSAWSQTYLADMPEAVSNHAVATTEVDGRPYVFTFGGISEGKTHQDIHKRCYKFDVEANTWTQIADLPSGPGRIAASASTVNGLIYVIGGYQVFANGQEKSLPYVHIYNPETDEWMSDGKEIPVAIDDQVQVTYRDSLIYVVTGWSDVTNVTNVQIYDPSIDEWQMGTPVPSSSAYRVFGGNGCMIGDTIYYVGGARAIGRFPISPYLKKGWIDPSNPAQITWTIEEDVTAGVYRPGVTSFDQKMLVIGGSDNTYNYDGIAYDGSGGIAPLDEIRAYNPETQNWDINSMAIPPTMDLRGLAHLSNDQILICGGMTEDQTVTDKTFLINLNKVSTKNITTSSFEFESRNDGVTIRCTEKFAWKVYTLSGQFMKAGSGQGQAVIETTSWPSGIYFLRCREMGKPEASTIYKILRP